MRLLIDSHVALWWLDDHPSLGDRCRTMLTEAAEVYFSAVTPWELGIKRALGEVEFPDGLSEALKTSGFTPLPISTAHAELAPELAHHHRDPFDRMLIAQAQLESLTLVTADRTFDRFDVATVEASA